MSTRRRYWTDAEVAELRRLYPHYPTLLIAQELGRTDRQVYCKAKSLGIKKSAAYMAMAQERTNKVLAAAGAAHRFQPGMKPANKGKRMAPEIRAKCAPTMFKPGRPAHEARNYQPIGTERVSKDGWLERKVTDDPTLVPARRWVPVHRLIWEEAHGPIPDGHIVVFRDRNRNNLELANLELITMAENMRRNTIHNCPEPLKRAIRAKAGLVRRINRIQKERSA